MFLKWEELFYAYKIIIVSWVYILQGSVKYIEYIIDYCFRETFRRATKFGCRHRTLKLILQIKQSSNCAQIFIGLCQKSKHTVTYFFFKMSLMQQRLDTFLIQEAKFINYKYSSHRSQISQGYIKILQKFPLNFKNMSRSLCMSKKFACFTYHMMLMHYILHCMQRFIEVCFF